MLLFFPPSGATEDHHLLVLLWERVVFGKSHWKCDWRNEAAAQLSAHLPLHWYIRRTTYIPKWMRNKREQSKLSLFFLKISSSQAFLNSLGKSNRCRVLPDISSCLFGFIGVLRRRAFLPFQKPAFFSKPQHTQSQNFTGLVDSLFLA